ncbi:hypothetical protein [Spirosoma linguale]|uniref:Uncharacterized protein n=1 Tax=Spirosoma linguale (strain ATCC 33905 / DSM 74 / LMG 10896 / Claus 1) TaxID=504472 RepID=D2QTM9_SPILD|nr:hypothetical protein Slin_6202 [Spirosoma linguale DSM 74]
MTVFDVLVEADNLVERNELSKALELLIRLGEKRLGKDISDSLKKLRDEVDTLKKEPQNQATELDLEELSELTRRYIDDIEYVYNDVGLTESNRWFGENVEKLKRWLTRLNRYADSDIDDVDDNEFSADKEYPAKETGKRITVTPRNSSTHKREEKESDTGKQAGKKRLTKESIVLVCLVVFLIGYVSIKDKKKVSTSIYSELFDVPADTDTLSSEVNTASSVKDDTDTLSQKQPGLYLTCDVKYGHLVTRDVITIIPFNKQVHRREEGIYYRATDIVNVFTFCSDLNKGTRLSNVLVGNCR